jgi:hypothetical protein
LAWFLALSAFLRRVFVKHTGLIRVMAAHETGHRVMDEYTFWILASLFGFLTIAAILLVPIYLFLNREEEASREWTEEALARRYAEQNPGGDGAIEEPDVSAL